MSHDHPQRSRSPAIPLIWAGSVLGAFALGMALRAPGDRDAGAGGAASDGNTPRRSSGGLMIANGSGERDRADAATSASRGIPVEAAGPDVGPRGVERLKGALDLALALTPGPERNERVIEALKNLGAKDGAAALEAVKGIPELKLRSDAMFAVLSSWAANDPKAAWAYVSGPDDGSMPRGRLWAFFHGLGQDGDPKVALDFVKANPETLAAHPHEIGEMFDEIHEKGGQELLKDWATSLPPGKLRDMALTRIVDQWARYDPLATREWMESVGTSKENLPAMRTELAESWARVDPKQALRWVASLPEEARTQEMYDGIFRRWMQYDRNGAAEWLANQPPSPALDRPIERYLWGVMRYDPAGSMAWAESITDQRRRAQMVEQISEVWRRSDPAALEHYLAESGYSQPIRDRLLKKPRPDKQANPQARR